MQVVAIGGGTGLSTLLRGLKPYLPGITHPAGSQAKISRLTAVVTVTDEGGSSGRLRRDFHILPPGDIRNCMVALAEDEHTTAEATWLRRRYARVATRRHHRESAPFPRGHCPQIYEGNDPDDSGAKFRHPLGEREGSTGHLRSTRSRAFGRSRCRNHRRRCHMPRHGYVQARDFVVTRARRRTAQATR